MREYGGFWIQGEKGNAGISWEKALSLRIPQKKIWTLLELKMGNDPVFAEKNQEGKLIFYTGLAYHLQNTREQVPYTIMDNHNHALYYWYEAFFSWKIKKKNLLIHLDQHSDAKENPDHIREETPEGIANFVNTSCQVGNFIAPALKTWLVSQVKNLLSEYSLLNFSLPKTNYILDIDLDFWAKEMSIQELEKTIIATQTLMRSAQLITFATSPYFIESKRAFNILQLLLGKH